MNTNQTPISQPTPDLNCAECRGRQDGFQIYTTHLTDQTLLAWDVELALKICSDGRSTIRLHASYLDEMLRVNHYDPIHLEHVDPTKPGIACVLEYTDDSVPVLCLIDGTHRGAVCRRDGLPFFVYVLTDEESTRCQHTMRIALYRAVVEPNCPPKLPPPLPV